MFFLPIHHARVQIHHCCLERTRAAQRRKSQVKGGRIASATKVAERRQYQTEAIRQNTDTERKLTVVYGPFWKTV